MMFVCICIPLCLEHSVNMQLLDFRTCSPINVLKVYTTATSGPETTYGR